jgi:hypothetical protein
LKIRDFGVVSLSTTSALSESKRRPIPGGVFAWGSMIPKKWELVFGKDHDQSVE